MRGPRFGVPPASGCRWDANLQPISKSSTFRSALFEDLKCCPITRTFMLALKQLFENNRKQDASTAGLLFTFCRTRMPSVATPCIDLGGGRGGQTRTNHGFRYRLKRISGPPRNPSHALLYLHQPYYHNNLKGCIRCARRSEQKNAREREQSEGFNIQLETTAEI